MSGYMSGTQLSDFDRCSTILYRTQPDPPVPDIGHPAPDTPRAQGHCQLSSAIQHVRQRGQCTGWRRAMTRSQQTHGNRAVQRCLQRRALAG
jgi:hypothetical protein